MKFALASFCGERKLRPARTFRKKSYRAIAVTLTIVFGWMMIQPNVALRAQQSTRDDQKTSSTSTKDSKRKKKRSKRSSNKILLPLPIFTTVPAQPPASTGGAAIEQKAKPPKPFVKPSARVAGATYQPTDRAIESFAPIDLTAAARQEALEAAQHLPPEIKSIRPPKERPNFGSRGVAIPTVALKEWAAAQAQPQAPPASATGVSPAPTKGFKGEFLNGSIIPPDTTGAVGTTHIVVPSNNMMRITDRNGVELSRVTLDSFWAGTMVKGNAVTFAFDPKILFDRFNNRFILVVSLNDAGQFSGAGLAVTQTADPTGTWYRYTVASDPASTPSSGHAIDYPSVGHNMNWIVVDENTFNFNGGGFTTYYGQQIFVFNKAAAYANTLGSVSLFEGTTCATSADLGCGFSMAPAVVEDNTTPIEYLTEDWDAVAGQLRLSTMTGTPSAPVLTVGTQFPQSTESWKDIAARIGVSGGYAPQNAQGFLVPSNQRLMTNDSRILNAVLRNGTLWATHTVMLGGSSSPVGQNFGIANPDIRSGIQWWAINPLLVNSVTGTAPLQRARIFDPTADNCHNGAGGTRGAPCNSTLAQVGQFYAFPNISVNQNNDVLIGFTQFSPLTYPSGGYAFRSNTDPINTTRDPIVFRPGQSGHNIGAFTVNTAARQNRWGDYSASQTDPLNDTDFWVLQEYSGTRRDFGFGVLSPWETYWALVKPSTPAPSKSGSLMISEFRLRGPAGILDQYVDLYNPASTPIIVNTTDNSDGWALAANDGSATTGIAVIPNGTVIRARGHLLITNDPFSGSDAGLTYSLTSYPNTEVRTSDGDIGWSRNIADTEGLAIFRTSNIANFSAATVMDAAGPATLPGGSVFKEGAGFAALPTTDDQYAMVRAEDQVALTPRDTNNNAADFVLIDTAATASRLGAAGPRNIDSPLRTNLLSGTLLDATVASSSSPNRLRDLSPGSPSFAAFGTMTIRRRLVNLTGAPVTRLRFRVINMTTFPPAPSAADLRLLSSVDTPSVAVNDNGTCSSTGGVPLSAPCTVTVRGLTLESPPAQARGGGLNSSVLAGTITLATPLAAGASINIQFLVGVQQPGNYLFYVYPEFLP